MKKTRILLSAILAGFCISLGGSVFLSLDSALAGAIFFTVGLYCVCTLRLHLFTGRVCYALQNGRACLAELPVIWLGNLLGSWAAAALESLTRNGSALRERAAALSEIKLNDSLLSLFVLGMLCNMLIYLAVEEYGKNEHELGKYLGLFFGVTVFIFCGFEHCVADMYYFFMAGELSAGAARCLLAVTLGNSAGGILFCELRSRLLERKK